jgi:hypothetical protein
MQETIHDRRLSLDAGDVDMAAPGADPDDPLAGIWLKHDARMHGGGGGGGRPGADSGEMVTSDFLRKFIVFARRR